MYISAERLPLVLVFCCLLISSLPCAAEPPVTAEDVNLLSEKTKSIAETFAQESFQLRLKYEYHNGFANDKHSQQLQELAQTSSEKLKAVMQSQRQLKIKIENYHGQDWDSLYGSTGLWRKLAADLYITIIKKNEIDFYLALTVPEPLQRKIVLNIIDQINTLSLPGLDILRAQSLAILAKSNLAYHKLAKEQFDILLNQPDIDPAEAIRASIEQIRFLGFSESSQLNKLGEKIISVNLTNDQTLILSLALLQRQYNKKAFEKTTRTFKQIEQTLGSLILEDITNRIKRQQSLEQFTVFEIALAVKAAWHDGPEKHTATLSHLAETKRFQQPLTVYVAALSLTNSVPEKAVRFFISTGQLQKLHPDSYLGIDPQTPARQGAQLAYDLFRKDPNSCLLTTEAFENYTCLAGEKIDPQLEYLYTIVLDGCGNSKKGRIILEKMTGRPFGYWRNKAKLQLITKDLQQSPTENQPLLIQLKQLIDEFHQKAIEDDTYPDVISIYCRLLLEQNDKSASGQVLDLLGTIKNKNGIRVNYLKAQAFGQLGKLEEAVMFMHKAIHPESQVSQEHLAGLLKNIIENIDSLQANSKDFSKMMYQCSNLAEFANNPQNYKIALMLAEFIIFEPNSNNLAQAEQILSNLVAELPAKNIDLLRCKARLLTAQQKFGEAAGIWSNLCNILKGQTQLQNQRSGQWWRAKYYELYCSGKSAPAQNPEISHTIEVLQNSFSDIPPFWSEKLNFLKNQTNKTDQH